MNYFIKSLWFGALLSPQCWRCACLRNPMMPLLIAAVLFFLTGRPEYVLSVEILICAWVLGMVLFIITPRRHYKLVHEGKTLYVFIYDTYGKWKLAVEDPNRDGIVRVFECDANGCRQSGENIFACGYDDSFVEDSAFMLIRRPYDEWQVLGNGYNNDTSVLILGRKIAHGTFIKTQKKPKKPLLFTVEGNKIVCDEDHFFQELHKGSYKQ